MTTADAIPSPDVLIIGSGIGGATIAASLAPTGARIVILERGERMAPAEHDRSTHAIFREGVFRPKEFWLDGDGQTFNPGNYYYVGGNSKFYGAVLTRYRREDFAEMELDGGVSPAWPFPYEELEPWYGRAEALYGVRGAANEDPTEPPHSTPYAHPPVPDEAEIAEIRGRLRAQGLHPYSLPLGVDLPAWLAGGDTPWDAFPNSAGGKMDAETAALAVALAHPNVTLVTGAKVERLETVPDGTRIEAVHVERGGAREIVRAGLVILSAGAINSAALLLRSADARNPAGLANRSDQVGRNFMNHNATAMIAFDPRRRHGLVYQKTIGVNDFYLGDGQGGRPLGNVQMLGKIDGHILKANMALAPFAALDWMAKRSTDWYLMSEDLPDPESRVTLKNGGIVLNWRRSNMAAHEKLVARMRGVLRSIGYPVVLHRTFDRRTPSHQCGTVRMGTDPAIAPLDTFCRAFDHPNLFVVDASFLPTSAAVNPALTVAAQALRVGDHIASGDLAA
ncbi:FAD-dependent oxidoreductase [Antarcticirhabdus aurantiaca]|uniref:GMC family oxidoreductase n=1 Tax=Antarcticirhabdus aurantiaca TaxID=2606717 RepID=A0ACD4NH52_9HYPH|nr:GMC family oxidoreductase [Antarcticirhabdus aurantiaca]WAJ26134.1 GMC family oxidoreductase [Jeongeuplla avenae]